MQCTSAGWQVTAVSLAGALLLRLSVHGSRCGTGDQPIGICCCNCIHPMLLSCFASCRATVYQSSLPYFKQLAKFIRDVIQVRKWQVRRPRTCSLWCNAQLPHPCPLCMRMHCHAVVVSAMSGIAGCCMAGAVAGRQPVTVCRHSSERLLMPAQHACTYSIADRWSHPCCCC